MPLILTALVLAAASIALPAVLGRAADAIIGRASRSWLTWAAVVVGALVVCDALEDLAAGATTARSTAWLRYSVLRHLLALGTRSSEQFTPGDAASRLAGNAADAGRVAPDVVRAAANAIPALGGIVALALIDPWLCATFLAGLPILAFLVRLFAREATDIAQRYLEVQARIAGRLVEVLSGARTIAAAGTGDREAERVLEDVPDLHRHGVDMWRAQIRISTQDAMIVSLLEVAVLAVAGAELAHGRITPGELLAASQYVVLSAALGNAVTSIGRLARDRAAAWRTAEVLAEAPVRYGTPGLPQGAGRIGFPGVTVHAGNRAALTGIDLVVPAGNLVAVVGRSGSGKSLLGALAGRLVDPDEGDVLLDGVPLRELDHEALRRAVAYSFERPALLGDTLSDVIAFGVDRPSQEALVAAARAAQADLFIRRMPQGYDTPLAEAPMSGGEAQRMGVARAFAHAGRVLVLDDVAASLDTVTEHEISRVLTDELADRTRLVMAHRASTAARADVVVWLDRGRVRRIASHAELSSDPDYRALFGGRRRPSLSRRAASRSPRQRSREKDRQPGSASRGKRMSEGGP